MGAKRTKRVALYLRVSTDGQTTDNQRRELEAVGESAGWGVVEVYEDRGISGARGRDKRPEFDRMLKDASRRRFDMIASWSVDRLGRSLLDLITFLQELRSLGCDLYMHKQALDTSTPSGRAMFGMLGVFAEFERAIIQERIKAGLARAREAQFEAETQGVRRLARNGRPLKHGRIGRPKVAPDVEERIATALEAGQGIRPTAREAGVGIGTVQRIKRELEAGRRMANARRAMVTC